MSILSEYWQKFQVSLFPHLEASLCEALTEKLQLLVYVIDVVSIHRFVMSPHLQMRGRPQRDRRAIARAFLAKAVYDMKTTEELLERLRAQKSLRRICGFERVRDIPSAATFSRAFAYFAKQGLGDAVHEALIKQCVGDKVVEHVSRDSTAVEAREKAVKVPKPPPPPKRKRGRPKKGEGTPPPVETRLDKQIKLCAKEAIADLPKVCSVGAKRNSHGDHHYWIGWKAHIDWSDAGMPLNVVTTSASLHDSQVAIPMAKITAKRVTSLYDLMDAAYDAKQIRQMSSDLGHVAIIDFNKRGGDTREMEPDHAERYHKRTVAERGNSRLKDEFGLRNLRVRGHAKAHLHIMFGILALSADAYRNSTVRSTEPETTST